MSAGTTIAAPRAGDAPAADSDAEAAKIVLLPGRVTVPDKVGHHDYLAGCTLLAFLLEQTCGVSAVTAANAWPADDAAFDAARALVLYTGGGRKHALISSPQRIEQFQRLVDRGVGLVMIHQAVRYPPEFVSRAMNWIGGVHVPGKSDRGHWRTHHRVFPEHPVTRGVQPWTIRDGWLNQIQFVDGMRGVTPLVWSSRKYRGTPEGGASDVVCWTYDRPGGGRAFCFTGLDAHSAWTMPGVRKLIVNGVLWTAGLSIPDTGAACAVDDITLKGYLTPRGSRSQWAGQYILRHLRRMLSGRR